MSRTANAWPAPPSLAGRPEHTPSVTRDELTLWVEQLGAGQFIERQVAMEQLTSAGAAAIEPLRAAQQSADPEVRQRARHVLRAIRFDDRQRLIGAFLAGVDVVEQELPGWTAYQAFVTPSPAARKLYAKMLEDEWPLLEAVDQADAAVASRQVTGRLVQLTRPTANARDAKPISLGTVATILLLVDREEIQVSRQADVFSLCYRSPEFNAAARDGELHETLHQLMNRLVTKQSTNTYLTSQLHFALQYDLDAALVAARQVIAERSGIPHVRQYAICVIGKLGDAADLQRLESLLDDQGVVTSHNRVNGERLTTQVRDIALAMLIHRYGEKFTDYGLNDVKLNPTTVLAVQSLGFGSDELRQQALAKWREQSHVVPAAAPDR